MMAVVHRAERIGQDTHERECAHEAFKHGPELHTFCASWCWMDRVAQLIARASDFLLGQE